MSAVDIWYQQHPDVFNASHTMDLDWDDDALRMQVRRLQRGQSGSKRKQPVPPHGQGTAPSAAHSQKVKRRKVTPKAAQVEVKMTKSERRKKLHAAKVAKVTTRGKRRPLRTPLATARLKVNLANSVQTIRVGTECSGLEAVMVAMGKMDLMHQTIEVHL
jgi:hypothetical protein